MHVMHTHRPSVRAFHHQQSPPLTTNAVRASSSSQVVDDQSVDRVLVNPIASISHLDDSKRTSQRLAPRAAVLLIMLMHLFWYAIPMDDVLRRMQQRDLGRLVNPGRRTTESLPVWLIMNCHIQL